MSVTSPRRLRSGKVIDDSYSTRNTSESHPIMYSDLKNAANADSDSNSSGIFQNGVNPSSQIAVNSQIENIQIELNELKGLLSTLTQQFISPSEVSNALRASSCRNPECIDSSHL